MPTTITHGHNVFTTGDFIDEVTRETNEELSERRGTNGNFAKAKSFNPTSDVTIKGGGNSGLTVGLATPTIAGLTGGVKYVRSDKLTQVNNEFDSHEAAVRHLPNAQNQA